MKRLIRVIALSTVGMSIFLLGCSSNSGDDPQGRSNGEVDDRSSEPSATASTSPRIGAGGRKLADDLSCSEVTDVSAQFGDDWHFLESYDCDIKEDVTVRVHTFADPSNQEAARTRFGYRYADRTLDCHEDPVVVYGSDWVVITLDRPDAQQVADALDGTIEEQTEDGPIVSYLPPVRCDR